MSNIHHLGELINCSQSIVVVSLCIPQVLTILAVESIFIRAGLLETSVLSDPTRSHNIILGPYFLLGMSMR